ncbi:MAG: hypothetical protein NTZ83_03525 [Candidatus Pacearchaeota archaeon]|nr:hypothetical protein [Candidatus Pacearchaeota archaeon]
MAKQIENKFQKEFMNHTKRWFLRELFEPGYMLKNAYSIPKEKLKKNGALEYGLLRYGTIGLEAARLGMYGLAIYKIADLFIK